MATVEERGSGSVTTRWLVTGARGLLGSQVVAALARLRPEDPVTAVDRAEMDLLDEAAVRAVVPGHDVVVSCAAWTDVDGAQDAATGHAAAAVNTAGAGRLAVAVASCGARLLHLSTDYVFDGAAAQPYAEDADPAPLSVYGATKRAGELLVLAAGGCVVRSAWLHDGARGRSFVATMAGRAAAAEPVEVVDDQVGQPTWVRPLAERLVALGVAVDGAGRPPDGIVHLASAGRTSWYGLAREVYRLSGADPALVSATTAAALAPTRPAPRPAYSVLADTRSASFGLTPMPSWDAALADSLAPRTGPD